jgi:ribosomal protein S18 acetylase RimI-like enzyme
MQFVDKPLARRLESAEEMPQVEYARYYAKKRPEIGAAVEELCGGHMIFAGLNSPIGRAVGMGFDGPVTAADLDRLEEFYRTHGAPAQLDLCPLSDPSLLELVKEREYGIVELNNVRYLRIGETGGESKGAREASHALSSQPLPPGIEIRRGTKEEAGILSSIVSRSFFEDGNIPEGFGDLLTPMYEFPGSITYGAYVDGEPAAAAAGLVIPEHRVLALFGAGTLPAFRGRGIQTALLRTRMQAAAEAGCEYAVIVTLGGTTSERNSARLGFQCAYSKATVIRNWPERKPVP